MPAPIYTIPGSAIAVVASTAKSVLGVKAHANSGILLRKVRCSFNSVTAADQPMLVEIMTSSWATNSPGTNSSSVTPIQTSGLTIAAGFTAGKTWTSEPTTLAQLDAFYLPPNSSLLYDFPLGDEPNSDLAVGFVVRVTPGASATSASFSGSLYVSRC